MPSCPRRDIVRQGEVGIYHCWSRCVRRAFLCGRDLVGGRNYDHRRSWISQFQKRLAALFGVEVCFHAEMSNHMHLVLRTRPDVVKEWTDEEVVRRWLTVTHLTRSGDGETVHELSDARIAVELADTDRIASLRQRLGSISYFMAALCEHIARRSNREDDCRGSFWESRFGCRELIDEAAILACGVYVDLNQIRAGEATTPESSQYTSAGDRSRAFQQRRLEEQERGDQAPKRGYNDDWL